MRLNVIGKRAGDGPDEGRAIEVDAGCLRVDVRQHPVAQSDRLKNRIVERRARLAKLPGLTGRVGAVAAEHGQKGAELKPSRIQLAVPLIRNAAVVVPIPEPLTAA